MSLQPRDLIPFSTKQAKKVIDAIESGANAVSSVFGRIGNIVGELGDYTTGLIENSSDWAGVTLDDALDAIDARFALVERLATGSINGLLSAAGYTKLDQLTPPLLVDTIIYVNSVAGNDTTGTGLIGAPFQTLSRAWVERQKYGELRARLTIQLLGAGPYSVSAPLSASACGGGGFLIIAGDTAAETSHATGTFTGDFGGSNTTIGTSAGLGSDTHKNRWVRITSGACVGAEFPILENTDTSITAASKRFRTLMSAVANGDSFKIFTPGTVIAGLTFESWIGGTNPISFDTRHIFHRINFSASVAPNYSQVIFASCKMTVLNSIGSYIGSAIINAITVFGTAANANLYRSAGLIATATIGLFNQSYAYGIFSTDGALNVGSASAIEHIGGRIGASTVSANGGYFLSSTGSLAVANRYDGSFTVEYNGQAFFSSGPALIKFVVTSGSCLIAQRGGRIHYQVASPPATGGTSDVNGYGAEVRGGVILFANVNPALTGGTSGKDLKTTNNNGVANSTITAAGNTAAVAADALLGEALARVA